MTEDHSSPSLPKADYDLDVAVRAAGANMHVNLPDDVVAELKSKLRGRLTPQQLTAGATSEVVAEARGLIMARYELNAPRNIYDANYDPAKDGKLANGRDEDAGGSLVKLDAYGRTLRDRNAGGRNNENGTNGRGGQYTDLSSGGYDPAYPGRPWALSQGGYQQYGFEGLGLSFGTAQDLARQGFAPEAIKSAAKFTGAALGIDVNQNVAAVARLKRDVPHVETGLVKSKSNWDAVAKLEAAAREAKTEEQKQKLQKEADAKRKEAEAHDHKEEAHVKAVRPERLPDIVTTHRAIKQSALDNMKVTKLKADMVNALGADDPVAMNKLAAAKAGAKIRKEKTALENIEKAVAADQKLEKQIVTENTKKIALNKVTEQESNLWDSSSGTTYVEEKSMSNKTGKQAKLADASAAKAAKPNGAQIGPV